MKYAVISNDQLSQLEEEVQKFINMGWKPQGGIAISTHVYTDRGDGEVCSKTEYLQAIIGP